MKATKVLALSLIIAGLYFPAAVFAQDKEVTVTAEGAIVDGNKANAKEMAIDACLRKAVEQTVGTMVVSESLTENYQLVSDTILTKSKGFVKKYDIVSEKDAGNVVEVSLKAVVTESGVEDELIKNGIILSRLGKPRVMILVAEQNVGQENVSFGGASAATVDLGICENALIDYFQQKGFDFVDRQVLAGKVTIDDAMAIMQGNAAKVKDLANLSDAEVLIAGKCIAKDAGTIMGTQMHSAQANITVRVINTDDGKIMATADGQGKAAHIDTVTGGTSALKDGVKKLSESLFKKLMSEWQKYVFGIRSVSISVSGIKGYKDVGKIKNCLLYKMTGVKAVNERKFGGGKVDFGVEMKGRPGDIAGMISLKDCDGVKLDVVNVSANKLELKVK